MKSLPAACKYLKKPGLRRTSHLVDKDSGEITIAVEKIHDLLLKTWQPLFRLYDEKAEPTWDDFFAEYRDELEGWRAHCPGPESLPADALEAAVRSRDPAKVGGPDNWSARDGQLLPSACFTARQKCFETVASGAEWPPPLLYVIFKNETGFPEALRISDC